MAKLSAWLFRAEPRQPDFCFECGPARMPKPRSSQDGSSLNIHGRKKAQNAQRSIGRRGFFLRLLRFFAAIRLHVHHFIALPLENEGAAPMVDPSHTIAIKRWTREYLKLPESSVVSVNEFACRDPGCPLLETVISVLPEGGVSRTWKLTRPRIAVTKTMIQQTLAMPPTMK